jgi:hypothetical protein
MKILAMAIEVESVNPEQFQPHLPLPGIFNLTDEVRIVK